MRFLNLISLLIYKNIFRRFFFFFDLEKVHHFIIQSSKILFFFAPIRFLYKKAHVLEDSGFDVHINNNLIFKNPVGLAAGFDKNADLIPGIDCLGFGFAEIGTVTKKPQIGNEKPRIFRFEEQEALLNRMGFPNEGSEKIHQKFSKSKNKFSIPLGINIGKNKDSTESESIQELTYLLHFFEGLGDYFTINISSPNTVGLRSLQNKNYLESLSKEILALHFSKPVFLKLSLDFDVNFYQEIASFFGSPKTQLNTKAFHGLILGNTLPTDAGGISGKPLTDISFEQLKKARSVFSSDIPIISVGGIFTSEDVQKRLKNGATAVQLYTALIYCGPSLIRELISDLKS